MVELVRHRQTKEAATDMLYLQSPRHISTLPFATNPFSAGAAQCPLLLQKRTNAGTAELSVTRHKETFTSTVGMSAKCRVSVSDINYRDCAAPRSRRHSYGCVCRDHSQPRAFQLQS